MHQVVHAERSIDPADEVLPPVLQGRGGAGVPVDRDKDQEPGLSGGLGFRDQLHFARHGDLARVLGSKHRFPAHRLREHVIAEGPEMPALEGFDVDHGTVDTSLARRTDGEILEALAADA